MIERSEHEDNFTVLTNDVLRDLSLSSEAFRLLCFMLSCSNDWSFSVSGLAYLLGWSERKTKIYVTELKKHGYLEQIVQRGEKGHFLTSEWVVHEEPITAGHKNRSPVGTAHPLEPLTRYNGSPVQRDDGNLAPLRNINTKEISISKKNKRDKNVHFVRPTLEEVAQYCQERKNGIDPQHFLDYYNANGWKVGRNSMKDWKAAVRNWERTNKTPLHCQPKEADPIDWDEVTRLAYQIHEEGGTA